MQPKKYCKVVILYFYGVILNHILISIWSHLVKNISYIQSQISFYFRLTRSRISSVAFDKSVFQQHFFATNYFLPCQKSFFHFFYFFCCPKVYFPFRDVIFLNLSSSLSLSLSIFLYTSKSSSLSLSLYFSLFLSLFPFFYIFNALYPFLFYSLSFSHSLSLSLFSLSYSLITFSYFVSLSLSFLLCLSFYLSLSLPHFSISLSRGLFLMRGLHCWVMSVITQNLFYTWQRKRRGWIKL